MNTNIALAFCVDGVNWDYWDEEFWLGPDETYHNTAQKDILECILDDETPEVQFRYEVWLEDKSFVQAGEKVVWHISSTEEDAEASCFDNAEEALLHIAQYEHNAVKVSRLIMIHTYGHHTFAIPGKDFNTNGEDNDK